ncbi:MAG: MFS transporter [Sphingomonadales bacterium]|nr:MFS transporter [Sphingomonadales bacterium]
MAKGLVSKAQQQWALGLSTTAFTVCFAVWTIFAIIGIEIKAELGLSDTQFGLLVGTPILTGSLVRVFLGIWADQYGGRLVFPLTMLASAGSTFLLSYADTYIGDACSPLWDLGWQAADLRLVSPMSPNGSRRKSRAQHLAFSGWAMLGRPSPNLPRRLSGWRWGGRQLHKDGLRRWH